MKRAEKTRAPYNFHFLQIIGRRFWIFVVLAMTDILNALIGFCEESLVVFYRSLFNCHGFEHTLSLSVMACSWRSAHCLIKAEQPRHPPQILRPVVGVNAVKLVAISLLLLIETVWQRFVLGQVLFPTGNKRLLCQFCRKFD